MGCKCLIALAVSTIVAAATVAPATAFAAGTGSLDQVTGSLSSGSLGTGTGSVGDALGSSNVSMSPDMKSFLDSIREAATDRGFYSTQFENVANQCIARSQSTPGYEAVRNNINGPVDTAGWVEGTSHDRPGYMEVKVDPSGGPAVYVCHVEYIRSADFAAASRSYLDSVRTAKLQDLTLNGSKAIGYSGGNIGSWYIIATAYGADT